MLNPQDLATVAALAWRAVPTLLPAERPAATKAILAVEDVVYGLTPKPEAAPAPAPEKPAEAAPV